MKRLIGGIAALVVGLLSLLMLGTQSTSLSLTASAAQVDTSERGRTMTVIQEKEGRDFVCEWKRDIANQPGRCQVAYVLRQTAKYSGATSPREARRGNAAYCRDWRATARGVFYVNWVERMDGTFCWIEGPSAPDIYRHTRRCDNSDGIGYDVQVVECWEDRDTGDTTYGWWYRANDKFRVSTGFHGFSFHWTHHMWVNQHPTGNIFLYKE